MCKSFANAFLGLRVADREIKLTDLVQAPGWDSAEVLRRNLTSAPLPRAITGLATQKSDSLVANRNKDDTCPLHVVTSSLLDM